MSDPGLSERLDGARASCLIAAGRLAEAHAAGQRILRRAGASDLAVSAAFEAVGEALIYGGRPDAALRLAEQHEDQVLRVVHLWPYGAVAMPTYRTLVHLFSGSLIEGAAEAKQASREAAKRGPDWAVGWTAGLLGGVLAFQGRERGAARLLTQAVILLRETNLAGQLPFFQSALAYSLALVGDLPRAEQSLRDAESTRTSSPGILEGWLALPRVWLPACAGETSSAIGQALEAAERLGSRGFRSQQAIALHDVARLGEPRRVVDLLSRVASSCDGRLIPAFARHAGALARSDAPALEQVSRDFASMGAYLLAAEAAAEAAAVHRDAGLGRAAARVGTWASEMAARCEGARTPALAESGRSLALTKREREVAGLAARGLSNKEIAGRLVLSVRTVENHLHRAFDKLGTEGRQDLGPALGFGPAPSGSGPGGAPGSRT